MHSAKNKNKNTINLTATLMEKKEDQPFLLGNLEDLDQHSFLVSRHFLVNPVDPAGPAVQEVPKKMKK